MPYILLSAEGGVDANKTNFLMQGGHIFMGRDSQCAKYMVCQMAIYVTEKNEMRKECSSCWGG